MPHSFKIAAGCFLVAIATDSVCAQRLTVQQPVVSRFGVQTTVSVPDRGSVLLGSVSRAGVSRYSTGPFRSGSSVGRFTQHSRASVSVYIHDFEELERQLLANSHVSRAPVGQRSLLQQSRYSQPAIPGGTTPSSTDRTATSIAETAYGQARIARMRNLNKARAGLRSSRRFAGAGH